MVSSVMCVAMVAAMVMVMGVRGDMYDGSSDVVMLTKANFASVVTQSDKVAVVEFYAPWCGHCKAFSSAYAEAAKNLHGIATVAAINCDEERDLCGAFGVQGFPTVKLFPAYAAAKAQMKEKVPDYQGPRTAAGVANAVVELLPSSGLIKTAKSQSDVSALATKGAVALLMTDKPKSSTLIKALALEFHSKKLTVVEVRDKALRAELMELFKQPAETNVKTPVLFFLSPAGGEEGGSKAIRFQGEIKYDALSRFFKQQLADTKQTEEKQTTEQPQQQAEEPQEELPELDVEEVTRLVKNEDLQNNCVKRKGVVCLLAVLDPVNLLPEELEEQIALLREVASMMADSESGKHSNRPQLKVVWMAASEQPKLVEQGMELRSGYPAVVAIGRSGTRFSRFIGAFEADSLENFAESVLTGRKGAIELPKQFSPIWINDVSDPAKPFDPSTLPQDEKDEL